MALKLPDDLVAGVRQRASHRCEYCQTSEFLSGQYCQVDHIIPRALGGTSVLDNLCLACVDCNRFKLTVIEAIDPFTQIAISLFNPRTQTWSEHFEWSVDGVQIIGLTPVGRVTMETLKMNRPLVVAARSAWVSVGRHPPD
jgi:hypothetical protein